MLQKPKSQDKNHDAHNTSPQLSDTNDAVLACTVAAKLLARQIDRWVRTTNTDVHKLLALLCKQRGNQRGEKPMTVDLISSKEFQIRARLSQQTVAAVLHFTKQSLGPATQVVSKCNHFVNSTACERILASVKDTSKLEIQVDGPISLNSIRIEVKGNLIRVR